MEFIKSPVILIGLIAFITIHIVSELVSDFIAKILTYVNIGLHTLLIIPMLNRGISIEEAVLVYMISLFAYTLTGAIGHMLRGGEAHTSVKGDDSVEAEEPHVTERLTSEPWHFDYEPIMIEGYVAPSEDTVANNAAGEGGCDV